MKSVPGIDRHVPHPFAPVLHNASGSHAFRHAQFQRSSSMQDGTRIYLEIVESERSLLEGQMADGGRVDILRPFPRLDQRQRLLAGRSDLP